MTNYTPEQRLQRAAIAIMAHDAYVAMNGVFMLGTKRVEPDPAKCPTAYTNGVDEVYGADFLAQCSDKNVRFLMIHECEHKMRRDLLIHRTLAEIDAPLANQAMDYVINGGILKRHAADGFATMDGPLARGCYDPKYDGWSTVQVFRDLREQKERGGGGGGGEPLDDHGWGDAAEMSEAEQAELQQQIDSALRQGAIAAGKLGTGVDRGVTDLLTPPIDWRAALQDFLTETCSGNDYGTWSRPNRRYIGSGVYMPSGISEKVGRIVWAGDMSGSIGPREQGVILGAVADMAETLKPEGLDVLYWDTQVASHETYDAEQVANVAQLSQPKGGGGTDVTCVPVYMREHEITPQCAIVLTDGYLGGGWGDWPCPVLWIIFDNASATPTTGTAIHINTGAL